MCEWNDDARRYFTGSSWFVDRDGPIDHDITVEIYGSQGTAGDVTRHIMVTERNYERMELMQQRPRTGIRPRTHRCGRRVGSDGHLRPTHTLP